MSWHCQALPNSTPPPSHPFTLLQQFWSLHGRTPPLPLTVLQGYLICPFWLMQKIGLLYLNDYDNEPCACCCSPTRSRISRTFPLWAVLDTAFSLAPEQWRSHLWGLRLLSFCHCLMFLCFSSLVAWFWASMQIIHAQTSTVLGATEVGNLSEERERDGNGNRSGLSPKLQCKYFHLWWNVCSQVETLTLSIREWELVRSE